MQAQDTDRTKFGDRDYSVICFNCGDTFEATRSDASFCSAKCRVAYGRRPAQRLKALDEMESMRLRIKELQHKYSSDADVLKKIQQIQSAAFHAIETIEQNIYERENKIS